jgi:hypothetical protein
MAACSNTSITLHDFQIVVKTTKLRPAVNGFCRRSHGYKILLDYQPGLG